jgi:hypothetical protein
LAVGEGLAPPEITIKLIPHGEVVKEQLQLFETRFPSVVVEDYVNTPDHIHAVIFLHERAGGASPSPTRLYIIRSIVHRHNTPITPNLSVCLRRESIIVGATFGRPKAKAYLSFWTGDQWSPYGV